MTSAEFKAACDKVLTPFGYSMHSRSGNWSMINYMNWEHPGEGWPGIHCTIDNNDIKVELIGDIGSLLQIRSPLLGLNHPQLSRFILAAQYYENLCKRLKFNQ